VVGLEGLSIGVLADHIGMSKSGLYAHFGSKEELQMATIATADEIYAAQVVRPALDHADALGEADRRCVRASSSTSSAERFPAAASSPPPRRSSTRAPAQSVSASSSFIGTGCSNWATWSARLRQATP
jgi:AcrR family transcriptional regulator